MKIETGKVPPKGYAYFAGDKLFFSAYSVVNGRILLSGGSDDLLTSGNSGGSSPLDISDISTLEIFSEMHFFDEKTEYRILCDGDEQHEFLLTEEDDVNNPDYVIIRENVWIRPEFLSDMAECRIAVVNRFEYTDDDRLCQTGYRLSSDTSDS